MHRKVQLIDIDQITEPLNIEKTYEMAKCDRITIFIETIIIRNIDSIYSRNDVFWK